MTDKVDNRETDVYISEVAKEVASNIRRLRNERGISQRDLAAWCNFEYPNMCRIESGRTNVTLQTISRVAFALGVDVRELFGASNASLKKKSGKNGR
ncbi:MAG: helix-turn-helix transcriptional regulator [Mucinivorans sp.]